MDNPDTGNTRHTRHRTITSETQKHNTTQKTKKMSNTDLTENRGEPGAHEGEPVPASYT
jgi:hypothetical protein